MSALTSLLVRDRIVPVSKIEEALQSQVLSGGDIDTVLLELDLVPEDVLSAYRAALFGFLPASRDEVMRAPREAINRVARELAREKNLVPLLVDGRALVVAAIEPLSFEETRKLRDLLGFEVSVRIVTRPRLLAGLSHHYGIELSPRTRRLVDALRKREPGIIPYVRPPSPSVMPALFSVEPADDAEASESIDPARTSEPPLPAGMALSEPGASLLPELSEQRASQPENDVETVEAPPVSEEHELLTPVSGAAFGALHGLSSEPRAAASAPTSEPAPGEVRPVPARAAAESLLSGLEVGRATTLPPTSLSAHIARATRGPISAERAGQLLAQAVHRDDALYVVLRYAQQFFDFVGVFSVGKEGARGRMAHGSGLSQELMEHVIIPLDGNGLFARAARDKRALVGDLSATDEERAAAALLGRPAGRPVLVVPVTLRGRTVLLLHADRDAEGISLDDAECVNEVAGALKDALRRIILQNKTLSRGSYQTPSAADESEAPRSSAEAVADTQLVEPVHATNSEDPSAAASEGAMLVAPAVAEDERPVSRSGWPDEALPEHTFPGGGQEEPELMAVDLEAVSRPGMYRRGMAELAISDDVPEGSLPPESSAREGAWAKLPGVPRTAPPPPRRESGAPTLGLSAGAYRYIAATGLVAESVRKPRVSAPAPALAPSSVPAPELEPDAQLAEDEPAEVSEETPFAKPSQPEAPAVKSTIKRLSLVTPDVNEPSVIIDMGDQVKFLVDALVNAPKHDELSQIQELVRLGESALPVLIQRFPGPLWIDRPSIEKSALRADRLPRGRDVSAVARALCAFGGKAAPYLAGKLANSDDDVSFYALLVAGEIVHPDLLDAVARRVLVADRVLRQIALDVLRRYGRLPQFAVVLRALADLSERPGRDAKRQLAALEALGALRDARTLETLIARLHDGNEAVVQIAHRSLVELTAQDFGPVARRWESWAEEWGARPRVEWLIESLMHMDVSLRGLASDELKRETQQYFGYHPGLPKKDRELAQRKYREWWQHEGKLL